MNAFASCLHYFCKNKANSVHTAGRGRGGNALLLSPRILRPSLRPRTWERMSNTSESQCIQIPLFSVLLKFYLMTSNFSVKHRHSLTENQAVFCSAILLLLFGAFNNLLIRLVSTLECCIVTARLFSSVLLPSSFFLFLSLFLFFFFSSFFSLSIFLSSFLYIYFLSTFFCSPPSSLSFLPFFLLSPFSPLSFPPFLSFSQHPKDHITQSVPGAPHFLAPLAVAPQTGRSPLDPSDRQGSALRAVPLPPDAEMMKLVLG